jgi:hypothetical protein
MNTVYNFPSIVFSTLVTITTFICSKMLVGFVPVTTISTVHPSTMY